MTHRRKSTWTVGAVLSLAAVAFGAWDRVMPWWTARENRARFEQAVEVCEAQGGRWFKGDCLPSEEAP